MEPVPDLGIVLAWRTVEMRRRCPGAISCRGAAGMLFRGSSCVAEEEEEEAYPRNQPAFEGEGVLEAPAFASAVASILWLYTLKMPWRPRYSSGTGQSPPLDGAAASDGDRAPGSEAASAAAPAHGAGRAAEGAAGRDDAEAPIGRASATERRVG